MLVQCVVMLSQDSFYRGLTPEELADVACEPKLLSCIPSNAFTFNTAWETFTSDEMVFCLSACWFHDSTWLTQRFCYAAYNFDHPDSIDNEAVVHCLTELQVRVASYQCPEQVNLRTCSYSDLPGW